MNNPSGLSVEDDIFCLLRRITLAFSIEGQFIISFRSLLRFLVVVSEILTIKKGCVLSE